MKDLLRRLEEAMWSDDDIRYAFDANPNLTLKDLARKTGKTVKQLKRILREEAEVQSNAPLGEAVLWKETGRPHYPRMWTKRGKDLSGKLFQLGVSVAGMGPVSAYHFDSDKEITSFIQLGQKLLKTLRPYGKTESELYVLKQWIYFKVLSMGKGKPDLAAIKSVTEPSRERGWQHKQIPDSLWAAGPSATKRIQTAADLLVRLYKMVKDTPKARKAQKAMGLAVRGGRPGGSLGS